jgi:hypothetical protein
MDKLVRLLRAITNLILRTGDIVIRIVQALALVFGLLWWAGIIGITASALTNSKWLGVIVGIGTIAYRALATLRNIFNDSDGTALVGRGRKNIQGP